MPTNQTANYQLSQWVKSDQVKMEDFNADNAKIDAAIKAEADARTAETAALTAAVALRGNCQIYYATYTGTGEYGWENPKSYTFPAAPVLYAVLEPGRGYVFFAVRGANSAHLNEGDAGCRLTWDGPTVSWSSVNPTVSMNVEDRAYAIMALLAADES